MKKAELLKYLTPRYPAENHGGGEWEFLLKKDADTELHSFINFSLRPPYQGLQGTATLYFNWASELDLLIASEYEEAMHVFVEPHHVRPESGVVTEQDIEQLIQNVLAWGEQHQSPDIIAQRFSEHYSGAKLQALGGTFHLMALAIKGNVSQLQEYREYFANGGKWEVSGDTNVNHIDNAIALAKDFAAGKRQVPIDFDTPEINLVHKAPPLVWNPPIDI